MQIVILSGGSGKRLWPLSNDTRSKQFLKLLSASDGTKESMIQRVVRQFRESRIDAPVTVVATMPQRDIIMNQLQDEVTVVVEPERRNTFPAVALASVFLSLERRCPGDEVVVVIPCDFYTEDAYFDTVEQMAEAIRAGRADLALMGIRPTYPSAKYGYVVPGHQEPSDSVALVSRFVEKPDVPAAERLIADGAYWNGGVFAFRVGYLMKILSRYVSGNSYEEVRAQFRKLPENSFDCEVVEQACSAVVVPFRGAWKDLGTWLTLTDELHGDAVGNVILDGTSENTHVINELEQPVMCIGTRDLIVAASCDGILVTEKRKSERIKEFADILERRPMFEERRWGEYRVLNMTESADGFKTLTKELKINEGKSISYQLHHHRDEVWTLTEGEGLLAIDGVVERIGRGETVVIKKEHKHAIKALKDLSIIEVQYGDMLVEEDIERFEWTW